MPTEESIALRVLQDTLAARPIDYRRVRDAVIAYTRARQREATPEKILVAVKAAFADLVHSDYAGAHALRAQAVSWAITEYFGEGQAGGESADSL